MSFVDVSFFWFLPAALALFWLMPRRPNAQNAVLVALSWAFCASWAPHMLAVLVAATALDYVVARRMGPAGDPEDAPRRRRLLVFGVTANLLALCSFKYANGVLTGLGALLESLGLGAAPTTLAIVLPVGLSYYTLQKLGYLFDVYDGREEPERNVLTFAAFASFFPQLVAGPISRTSELRTQLRAARKLTPERVAVGSFLFLQGFVIKGLLADTLAPMVSAVVADGSGYSALAHWMALLGFTAQLFGDFAGYSLMAIGTAQLFGVDLPENFRRPFISQSLPEFWRRWHITLNRWLFDFVYAPLCTGSGWLRGRVGLCLFLVFFLSGLWHGSTLPFLVWGALHGIGMVVHHGFDQWYKSLCRRDRSWVALRRSRPWAVASWALTQAYFVLTLIPFMTPDIGSTGAFVRGLLAGSGAHLALPRGADDALALGLGLAAVVWMHLGEWPVAERVGRWFFRLPAPVRGIAYGAAVAVLVLLVPVGAGTFIYRNF